MFDFGLLVRVGIDSEAGGWNAPCSEDGRFCYVPIPDGGRSNRGSVYDHRYEEFRPFAATFGITWPPHLKGTCHLDPDFVNLTYGDRGTRGKRIGSRARGDFLVFWSAMRCVDTGELICSIVGIYLVAYVLKACDVSRLDSHRNAHTRYTQSDDTEDIVVFADPAESGRLRKHIRIGAHRNGAQRVDKQLLNEWGGLCREDARMLKDGYIQRSAVPPIINDPRRFMAWFREQKPKLVHANNI